MYTLILSDLDETLLIEHHVSKDNLEAIKKARKKGIQFIPATGRSYTTISDILKELEVYDMEGEYSICFNGGLIMENKGHKILNFSGLSFTYTKEIFEIGANYDVCVMIFTLDMCYIFKADPLEVERKVTQGAPFKVLEDYTMDFLKDDKIAKILFVKRDMKYLKLIEKEIQEITKDKISVSYSSNRYLEFNALGIDKGYGLRWIAKYLDIPITQTIAIGDNYNDLEMIKEAGLGVAIQCAENDIKEAAQYITKNNYDQGAVKEVIEKFVLDE